MNRSRHYQIIKVMKKMNSILLLLCTFLLCGSCTQKDEFTGSVSGDIKYFYSKLTPVESAGTSATGTAKGTYYANINVLDFQISWKKLYNNDMSADPITAFYFRDANNHSAGSFGSEQQTASGSYSIKLRSNNGLNNQVKDLLLAGGLNIYVCTQQYPEGILCGQLAVVDEIPEEVIESKYNIVHPCQYYTAEDFDFVAGKIRSKENPWNEAFDKMRASVLCDLNYTPNPTEYIVRDGRSNAPFPNNYATFDKDSRMAWTMALVYQLSGNADYGRKAIEIMDAWVKNCKGPYEENGSYINPDFNLIALEIPDFMQAAEIMRESDLWPEADAEAFGDWMVNHFADHCVAFFSRPTNKGSVSNWDMAQVIALLSMGIYTNDDELIDIAVDYFKEGAGNGSIIHALPRELYHQDPDSDEILAQYQEVGRDQGHGSLSVRLMTDICQLAKNIGIDLYAYQENGILAMVEYCCKLNLTKKYPFNRPSGEKDHNDSDFVYPIASIPYTAYTWWEGTQFELSYPKISLADRGSFCGACIQTYYHYTSLGFSAKYAKQYMDFYPMDIDDYYLRNNLMYRR